MKKNSKNRKFFFILVIILILIPLILFLVLPKLNADTWMGFLGGYLGAIIGIVGVVIGIKIQLDSDKQTRNDEKIDNTFFNLLSTLQNIIDNLESDGIFEDLYENLNKGLLLVAEKVVIDKISENIEWILEEKKKIIEDLENNIIPNLKEPYSDIDLHMHRMMSDYDKIGNKELESLHTFVEIHDLLQTREYKLKNYSKDLHKFHKVLEQMDDFYLMVKETKNRQKLKKLLNI